MTSLQGLPQERTGETPKGVVISGAEFCCRQSQRGAQRSQPVLLSVSFLFHGEKESKEHHLNQFAERRQIPSCVRGSDSGYQPLHPWVNEGKVSEHVLVHTVDEGSVSK